MTPKGLDAEEQIQRIAPIGADGEDFLNFVNKSLSELASLRSEGQKRISGDQWTDWHSRLMAIKKNPLTAATNTAVPPVNSAPPSKSSKAKPRRFQSM